MLVRCAVLLASAVGGSIDPLVAKIPHAAEIAAQLPSLLQEAANLTHQVANAKMDAAVEATSLAQMHKLQLTPEQRSRAFAALAGIFQQNFPLDPEEAQAVEDLAAEPPSAGGALALPWRASAAASLHARGSLLQQHDAATWSCPKWPEVYDDWMKKASKNKVYMHILHQKSTSCAQCNSHQKIALFFRCVWKPSPWSRRRLKNDPGIISWFKLAPDLRPELVRQGDVLQNLQQDFQRTLGSFLTSVKGHFETMSKSLSVEIEERTEECQEIVDGFTNILDGYNGGVETIVETIANTMGVQDMFKENSMANREERDGVFNQTVEPTEAVVKGIINFLRKDMERFKKTRIWMHEEANSQRHSEEKRLVEENQDTLKDEAQLVESEQKNELQRIEDMKEQWWRLQAKIMQLIATAGESYKDIDIRTQKQLKRVNRRSVSRMKIMEFLRQELNATGMLAAQAVIETNRLKSNDVQSTYADTMNDVDQEIRVVEKDVEFMWKTYTEGVKASYKVIDQENAATVGKQNMVNSEIADSQATLYSIKDEFRSGAESLAKYTEGMRNQIASSTEDQKTSTKNQIAATASTINGDNMKTLFKVKNDARVEMAQSKVAVAGKSKEIMEFAHQITKQAEHDADQGQDGLEAIERGDLAQVERNLETMRKRQDQAYQDMDNNLDMIDGKVRTQDDKLYGQVFQQTDKFEAEAFPEGPSNDPYSVSDAGKGAINTLKEQTKEITGELNGVESAYDRKIKEHSAAVVAKMKVTAQETYRKLNLAKSAANKTADLANHILPLVKDVALTKATEELAAIDKAGEHLSDEAKRAVTAAAVAENVDTAKFVTDSSALGTGLAGSVLHEIDVHTGVLEQAQQDVLAVADKAALSHHNLEEGATMTKGMSTEVLGAVGSETAAVSKGLSVAGAGATKVVHADSREPDTRRVQALANIKTALSDSQKKGFATVNKLAVTAGDGVEKMESGAATELLATKKSTLGEARSTTELYSEKLADAHAAFRALVAHIHGLAANATEWGDMVEEEIRGASAAAHRQAMVGAKTRLEQQGAIDTRYRQLQAKVMQDVEGLDDDAKRSMAALTAESKKAAQRVLANTAMSEEEKLKALEKVDNWLADELHSVQDRAASEESELVGADGQARDFDAEAKERAYMLKSALDADKSAAQHAQDKQITSDEVSIDDLIQDADQKSGVIVSQMHTQFEGMKETHQADAAHLQHTAMTDMKVALEAMSSAVNLKDAAEHSLGAAAASRTHSLAQEERELQALVETAKTARQGVAGQLGATQSDREQRYAFLSEWTAGFQTMSAESMEQLTKLLYSLVRNDKDYFAAHSEKIAKFASRLADVLESESIQTLSKIGHVDKGADDMLEADAQLLGETAAYDRSTARYRQKVATSLDHLTGGLTGELAALSTKAAEFQYGMKKDADHFSNKSEEELRKMLKGQTKAVQTEQHRMEHQLDGLRTQFAANMKDTTEDTAEVAKHADAAGEEEAAAQANLHDMFDGLMGGVGEGGVVEDYARTLRDLLKAKQEELDASRERLDIRVKGLSAVVATGGVGAEHAEGGGAQPAGLLELGDGGEQAEYTRLVAEHSALASKAKRLAVEARRIHAS